MTDTRLKQLDQISPQEIRIYRLLHAHPDTWFSNRDIASQTKGVARTVRAHTRRFAELGLVDKVHGFPGDRFRLSSSGVAKNQDYLERLWEADVALMQSHARTPTASQGIPTKE